MNRLKIIKGHLFETGTSEEEHFTRLYLRLRKTEGRIYSDKQAAALPRVPASHPYQKEWKKRRYSCEKLLRYIKKHPHISDILEVGCGNGWLTANLSTVTKGSVTGIDINSAELQQARKIFGNIPQVSFVEGDIRYEILGDKKFDLIVFAASIQYFRSVIEIINVALSHLTLQGEIHVIDSHFYRADQVIAAKERSRKYFIDLGFPEMINYYFHPRIDELTSFRYHFLNNPSSWIHKVKNHRKSFHWVVITNFKI